MQPLYDNQQELYAAVFSLLSNAREDFAQPAGPVVPGGDDLIYQGSVADWIRIEKLTTAHWILDMKPGPDLGAADRSHNQKAEKKKPSPNRIVVNPADHTVTLQSISPSTVTSLLDGSRHNVEIQRLLGSTR